MIVKKNKVKSVTRLPDFEGEYVYDVVMVNKDRQWFFGNNILVHNSTYFSTFAKDIEMAETVGDIIGKKVNESFPKFMRDTFFCTEDYSHFINTDREAICSRGIFIKKKLYILHIVNNEGKVCDKIKAMGISLKKSTLPKEFQLSLTKFMERLLKGEEWNDISIDIVDYKEDLSNIDNIARIGLPKGVNGISVYTKKYEEELLNLENYENGLPYILKYDKNKVDGVYKEGKERYTALGELDDNGAYDKNRKLISTDPMVANLPGHVAASILWNIKLEEYGDKESLEISSGTKIKVFYFKEKYGRFSSIAIPTDIQNIPKWFLDNIEPLIDTELQLYKLIDKTLEQILTAAGLDVPTKQSLYSESLISY